MIKSNLHNKEIINTEKKVDLFNLCFENNPNPFAVLKLIRDEKDIPCDLKFVEINEKFLDEILHLSKKQVVGANFTEIFSVDVQYWLDKYFQVIKTGKPLFYEYYSKKNKQFFDVSVFSPIQDYCAITLTEISSRKQIQDQIKNNEKRFRTLVNFSPTALLVHNKGLTLYSNQAFNNMFKINDDSDIIGMPINKFIDPTFRDMVKQRLIQVTDQDITSERIEEKLIKLDGTKFIALVSSTKINFDGEDVLLTSFYDITEQKAYEEKILESENKYRLLAENMSDMIWKTDMDLKFTYLSPSALNIRGYTIEEGLKQSITDIMTPDSVEIVTRSLQNKIDQIKKGYSEGWQSDKLEIEIVKKDKTTIWVQVVANIVKGDDGLPKEIIGVTRNINEQKKAEFALKKSEEQYRSLIANAPGIHYRCAYDENWTMEYISDEIERLWGYKASDFIRNKVRTFTSIVLPEDVKNVADKINMSISTKEPYSFEYRVIDSKNTVRWVLENGRVILDNKGNIKWLDGVILDITDRKEIENKLLEHEKQLEGMLDQIQFASKGANIAIWESWPQTGKILANEVWATQKGFEPLELLESSDRLSEVIGGYDSYKVMIQPDDLILANKQFERCLKGETDLYRAEYRVKFKDEKWHWILDLGKVFEKDSQNHVIRMNGIHLDITEIKEAEYKLHKYADDLTEVNATKDKLFRVVAHDLKSPALAILGTAELMKNEYNEIPEEEKIEIIEMLYDSSVKHFRMLRDLLDWSRSHMDGLIFKNKKICLINTVKIIKEQLQSSIQKKSIKIITDKIIDFEMVFDEEIIRILLRNLISNAIKFSFRNGQIEIAASQSDKDYQIYVIDNGVGIDENDISKILKENYSETKFGTEGEKGTGLGLSLVKNYLQKCNGKLMIKSEVGKGSEFRFLIPKKY